MKALRSFWSLVRDAERHLLRHNPSLLAGGFAYFTVFSMIPFFVILLAIFGRMIGVSTARDQLLRQVASVISPEAAEAADTFLTAAVQLRFGAVTALSGLLVLFGASRMFNHLQSAMNMIWEVEPPRSGIVRRFLRARARSFAMLAAVYGVMLGMFLLGLVSDAINVWIVRMVTPLAKSTIWQSIHLFSSIFIPFLLFALTFRYVPSAKVEWRDVAVGAGLTTLLFATAKLCIGVYLSMSHIRSIFGIAGSVIVMLIWVYFSALILFYGASFTYVYSRRFGSRARRGLAERA